MTTAIVVGGGPAGLMAAHVLARAGAQVTVIEAKPSLGRKFLMAGKSGLNLTKDEPFADFTKTYAESESWLLPALSAFAPRDVVDFANSLRQETFVGSSGRVFPKVMKASPLLRAWITELTNLNVAFLTKWSWTGWHEDALHFDTPDGVQHKSADVVVLALGGKSWARLGSDGVWAEHFKEEVAPFQASNVAMDVAWSAYMSSHFGTPLKSVAFSSGAFRSRGEAVITRTGLEGGGVYTVSRGVREGHDLSIDLKPDWTEAHIVGLLQKPQGKVTTMNHLRKVLKLAKHELALLNECARPLPKAPNELAKIVKQLTVQNATLRPMDEAISTSGGILQSALNEDFMLKRHPGVFCAGEMLDWDAPTGGYLLTACFATGRAAGRGAAKYLGLTPAP